MTDTTVVSTKRVQATKPESKAQITLPFLLEAVRRWWQVCFPVGMILALVASLVIWFLFEPVYESRSVIRIAEQQVGVLQQSQGRASSSFVNNELALIRSPLVLGRVLRNTDVLKVEEIQTAIDPESELAGMINVKSAGGTEIHYITCTAKSADDAKLICDEVAKAYFLYRVQVEEGLVNELLSLLEDEGTRSENYVEELQQNLRALLKKSDELMQAQIAAESDESGNVVVKPLVHTPLVQLQTSFEIQLMDFQALQGEIAELKASIDEPIVVDEKELIGIADNDPYVRNLQNELARLEAELADSTLGADHPENQRRRTSIERTNGMIEEGRQQAKERRRDAIVVARQESRRQMLANKEQQLQREEINLETLNDKIETHSESIAKANQSALDVEFLREDLNRAKEIRDQLRQRALLLATEKMAPKRVTRADPEEGASLPRVPVEAIPVKKLAIASILGFVFPFAIMLLWEMRVRRVSSSEDLEQQVDKRLVGEIAVLPVKGRIGSKLSPKRTEKQFRLFEESVDSLRTFFTLSTQDGEDHKAIAVTSAAPNEGKTTIASQLAISLGRATRSPVLLVDADLRAPDVHFVFGFDNSVGLIDVLEGTSTFEDAILEVVDDNLHVLPAGELDGESPHHLVDQYRMKELVTSLRKEYEYIVFDTSPILSSSESLHVTGACDATILSVMRDVSRIEQVKKVAKRIEDAGVHLEGLVLSGVPQYKYSYNYGVYGDYAK